MASLDEDREAWLGGIPARDSIAELEIRLALGAKQADPWSFPARLRRGAEIVPKERLRRQTGPEDFNRYG